MKLKKKTVESEIFTGSMADVSFLLIIYFMITSAFSATRGLDFALPEDTTTPQEIKKEDTIDVYVLPGPVDEAPVLEIDKKQIPIEGLVPYVVERLEQNPDKPIILRTDPSASYGNMIAVFDELRRAENEMGIKMNISIPTQREIENIWTLLGIG